MASMVASNDFLLSNRLRGHKGQVLCAAAPQAKTEEAVVATGAEDSTIRIWDLRDGSTATNSPRVVMCICRCFDNEPVASVVFSTRDAKRLYGSAGGKVFEFDLRLGGGGLLMTRPSAVLGNGEEEVNELAIHTKGEHLAAADDSGMVNVYNTTTRRVYKRLNKAHSSICHAVRFRPRATWELASGALDSTLVLWDFNSGKIRQKIDFTEDANAASSSASDSSPHQLFNPPFVHSIDFSVDGRFLAAGLGDSGVVILDSKTRAHIGRCDGHSAPLSQVHYPIFDAGLLMSAGNDRRLLVWDHRQFEREILPADGRDAKECHLGPGKPTEITAKDTNGTASGKKGSKGSNKKKSRKKGGTKPATPDGEMVEKDTAKTLLKRPTEGRQEGEGDLPEGVSVSSGCRVSCSIPLSSIVLEDKPNWVTSLMVPFNAIVVADTSSDAKILRPREA